MAIEIERKFLVLNDDWRREAVKAIPMRHGYLTELGGRASVRVRIEGNRIVSPESAAGKETAK